MVDRLRVRILSSEKKSNKLKRNLDPINLANWPLSLASLEIRQAQKEIKRKKKGSRQMATAWVDLAEANLETAEQAKAIRL